MLTRTLDEIREAGSVVLEGFDIANAEGGAGGPLAVLLITIIAVELGKLVSKETKVDILVTPFVTIFTGGILAILCAPPIGKWASEIGTFINWATEQVPFVMGLLIAVVIGIVPISSGVEYCVFVATSIL